MRSPDITTHEHSASLSVLQLVVEWVVELVNAVADGGAAADVVPIAGTAIVVTHLW
jgi:hypothetical protein